MDIMIVGGPHSGVGKTRASEIAVRALAGRSVGAIKLTVADGERDPTHDHGASALAVAHTAGICGRGASCGVCETVSTRVPSRLIFSEGAIRKPNTDTCRLHDAGAVAVGWIITLRGAAPQAVLQAIAQLETRGAKMILIEGTTALEWLKPRASIMVVTDPGRQWKDVAVRYIEACDIVLLNKLPIAPGNSAPPVDLSSLDPLRCDLSNPANPGTMEYVRRVRLLCGVSERTSSSAGAVTSAN
jgi:hypothetical protein